MTRINVGIQPWELCDQHLFAERYELPRLFKFKSVLSRPPPHFTLGAGHVRWCAQYQGSLRARLFLLHEEADHRGARVGPSPDPFLGDGDCWTAEEVERAVPIVRARICERLVTMEREPKWTKREPPDWVRDALKRRHAPAPAPAYNPYRDILAG